MKKILLASLLIFSFCISACSCDNFSQETYSEAVKYYNNSTGIDYKLTKYTRVTNSNTATEEQGTYKYKFTPNREVIDFASIINTYKIEIKNEGTNGNPNKVFELDRYYKSSENKFYTKIAIDDIRNVENISYEEKYDENSEYHVSNLVPTFDNNSISDYKITKHESLKRYSVATFVAACPATTECDADLKIVYKVTIDKDFYFNKIEFTTVKTLKEAIEATEETPEIPAVVQTVKYTYEFNNFNNNVNVVFPNDLVNY